MWPDQHARDLSVIVYNNDILIYSKSRKQHLTHVRIVNLLQHHLYVKAEKVGSTAPQSHSWYVLSATKWWKWTKTRYEL